MTILFFLDCDFNINHQWLVKLIYSHISTDTFNKKTFTQIQFVLKFSDLTIQFFILFLLLL